MQELLGKYRAEVKRSPASYAQVEAFAICKSASSHREELLVRLH